MIIRKDKKDMRFGQILNGINKVLSIRAVGLYTVLAQHPPEKFDFSQKEIIRRCFPNDGSGIIKTAWKELKDKGFLVANYKTVNGATIQYWDFIECPESVTFENSLFDKSENDKSKNDKSIIDLSKNDKSKNDKSNIDIYSNTDSLVIQSISNTEEEVIHNPLSDSEKSNPAPKKVKPKADKEKHGDYLLEFRKVYFGWSKHVPQTTKGQAFANSKSIGKIITSLVSESLKAKGKKSNTEISLENINESHYQESLLNFKFILENWEMKGFEGQARIMGTKTELGLIALNIHQIWIFLSNKQQKTQRRTDYSMYDGI
jgi:hypothetical protein